MKNLFNFENEPKFFKFLANCKGYNLIKEKS